MEWIRRNPQVSPECEEGLDCPQPAQPTSELVLRTTVAVGGGAAATQIPTAADSATGDAGVAVTSVFFNTVDPSYTSEPTIFSTTGPAAPIATSPPSVVTEAPTAAQAESKRNSDGVSKGAVAGIAIGTCIVGAAIAFAIAWLLFKRRDKRFLQKTCPAGYPIYADSSPELVMVQKSAATGSPYVQVSQTQMRTPVPVPARVPVPTAQDSLAGILPPAASEHDIQNRVAALFGQMHRHIDTYYRDVHASITPSMDSDLASFGRDVNTLELLQNCSSPTVALKHALVVFVLGVAGPKSENVEQSIWPNELASDLYSDQTSSGPASSQLATAQALHRRLTIYLYTHANALTPQNRSQSRFSNLSTLSLTRQTAASIREAAEHFSLTFFPWANPAFGDQERESDLVAIIGEALECRVWLCGQAGEWDFEWEVPGRGAVVVAPALLVREDRRGPRRVVLNQSIVSI